MNKLKKDVRSLMSRLKGKTGRFRGKHLVGLGLCGDDDGGGWSLVMMDGVLRWKINLR